MRSLRLPTSTLAPALVALIPSSAIAQIHYISASRSVYAYAEETGNSYLDQRISESLGMFDQRVQVTSLNAYATAGQLSTLASNQIYYLSNEFADGMTGIFFGRGYSRMVVEFELLEPAPLAMVGATASGQIRLQSGSRTWIATTRQYPIYDTLSPGQYTLTVESQVASATIPRWAGAECVVTIPSPSTASVVTIACATLAFRRRRRVVYDDQLALHRALTPPSKTNTPPRSPKS